jgi:ectoine hydroxylase-related dioxygenase (phytanoyl-CoA dioxygenase family)
MINISLANISKKKFKNIDEKYIFLLKKNKKLKSHYYDLTKLLDEVVRLSVSNKFIKIGKKLLNSKTILVDAPQIRADHKFDKRFLPQHQELNQISKDVINFWIPLVNVDKKGGGLFFRPKTHKLGHIKFKNSAMSATADSKKRQKTINKLFSAPSLKKYKSICPKLNAGDAVIFQTFIFHGTTPNKLKRIRWTYVSRFNSIKKVPYLKNSNSSLRIPYKEDYNKIN